MPVLPERLVIVVRADPVICGHSGEARNLAEAARERGIPDVRIVTWPIDTLGHLPLKPLDSVLPYSEGITVERPEGIGDYKIPDGRFTAGMTGRLVELFTDGVPTVAMSLYLTPHATAVADAVACARACAGRLGRPIDVTTVAEAVGSDITGVVRACVEKGQFGAAAKVFEDYLAHDRCVAVSEYTKEIIVEAATSVDHAWGTDYAAQCTDRIGISYPAINADAFTELDPRFVDESLARRGLSDTRYALFLSRIAPAKGVDDLIDGFAQAVLPPDVRLVIAGTGPSLPAMRERAAASGLSDRIEFFDDVDDAEKCALMARSAAYVLPSKPKTEFVETFGIALVEKMLAGGGPVITTSTGGIPEAVGDCATIVPTESPGAIAAALEDALVDLSEAESQAWEDKARTHARQFDRLAVFDRLFASLDL